MDTFQFHKRDTSWLSFNHRVLQEAKDPDVPLYERIKFLAIYSSNLDEFYRVRVSALRQFKNLNKDEQKSLLNAKPKQELKVIKKIVHQQQTEFGKIFRNEILPSLRQEQIYLINNTSEYTQEQKQFIKQYFIEKVLPLINRLYLSEQQEAPFLKNKGIYLLAQLEDSEKIGLVNIPSEDLDRFLVLPSTDGKFFITFLDDIIRFNMQRLFEEKILKIHSIKVSRDAELYIDDEFAGDLLEKIKNSLDRRNTGLPTRMLYDSEMPIEDVTRLKNIFQLKKDDLFPGGRYHNFSDFFGFPNPSKNPIYHDQALPPLAHPVLSKVDSLLACIHSKDQILHFPYQHYGYIPQMILEAAEHPEVETIKITLYRVASKSDVVTALLYALERGKKVVAFIEAKARFDEASNIFWGKELETAGATVLYSYPIIKVHTKLLLIGFSKESDFNNIAYIGTGNFNEKTAKLYGDHALLTTKVSLVKEVGDVFGILERKILLPKTKKLFISPFSTRRKFEKLIQKEIASAQAGKEAYMILKMNSLQDEQMIEHLYRANNAGVKITLIVRGICCLVAGIAGQSENITVYSLVDRFLEHARVYIFANQGKEKMYIASADWMTRNLDRRIEVVAPILDPDIYQELREIIDIQLSDNTKSRLITQSLSNSYVKRMEGDPKINAQTAIYDYLAAKLDQ